MNKKKHSKVFNYIDAVYCINLDHRKDRWNKVQLEFKKIKIQDKITRFSGVNTLNGRIGCMLSHRRIIEESKNKGFKNVLIFEDDIEIQNGNVVIKQIKQLKNYTYSMAYLGGIFLAPNARLIKKDINFYSINKGVWGASAYIINEKIFQLILDILPENGEIEDIRINNFDAIYATFIQKHYICLIPEDVQIWTRSGYSDAQKCYRHKNNILMNKIGFYLAKKSGIYTIKYILLFLRIKIIRLMQRMGFNITE